MIEACREERGNQAPGSSRAAIAEPLRRALPAFTEKLCWPASELENAVDALLRKSGFTAESDLPAARANTMHAAVDKRLGARAAYFGCETVPINTTWARLSEALDQSCPAILRLPDLTFVAVWKTKGQKAWILDPSGLTHTIGLGDLCEALRTPAQITKLDEYSRLFAAAKLSPGKVQQAASALLEEEFGGRRFGDLWMIRKPVSQAGLAGFLSQSGVFGKGALLVGAHVAEYLLWLAAWAVIGKLSFAGRMDQGWLLGWGLLLMTAVPFRLATTWLGGVLAIGIGSNLKRRLLAGSLALDDEAVRHLGVGSFLSQALEAEAVETLALSGGITGLLALIELAMAGIVMGSLAILLAGWCCVAGVLVWRFFHQYEQWTGSRMEMTGDLVESMAGHRTRMAQMPPERWHESEEAGLIDYFAKSQSIDKTGIWLVTAMPRGWLIAGLLWLVPSAMAAAQSGASAGPALAVKLGGVLLAFTAFKKLMAAAVDLSATAVAARRIAPLFRAAVDKQERALFCGEPGKGRPGGKLLEADRMTFRYREEGPAALQPTCLTIHRGEKILLEGSSGGGKTTLASLLSGMRRPASGLLLLNGFDCHTVGPRQWRRTIAAAPQFHENYIFTETLAYNLLLGRDGPLGPQDMQEADELCRELGLGDLLDRMPGGIDQMVGEGGWQLSHGERSRIYAARALLQRADCIILDESFGALDPENLRVALQCTLKHAETLMVIAHP